MKVPSIVFKKSANKAPRWAGKTVVCAASGPSLTAEDLEHVRARGAKLIAVNASFMLAPWADVCYGADYRFWQTYEKDWKELASGELWTMSVQAKKEYGLNVIGRCDGDGYSFIPHTITTGGNSGYQAVHLAAYWGATRIILLGYDMKRTNGQEHWHGKHKGGLPNGRNYGLWVRRFHPLLRDLKWMGIEVINCSRETALRSAPRLKLEEVTW